jgi:hypothetical protein
VFSGYRLDELDVSQRRVVEQLDWLIDGRFQLDQPLSDEQRLQTRFPRGSRNQVVHCFSGFGHGRAAIAGPSSGLQVVGVDVTSEGAVVLRTAGVVTNPHEVPSAFGASVTLSSSRSRRRAGAPAPLEHPDGMRCWHGDGPLATPEQ